jgi:hypothetical protein
MGNSSLFNLWPYPNCSCCHNYNLITAGKIGFVAKEVFFALVFPVFNKIGGMNVTTSPSLYLNSFSGIYWSYWSRSGGDAVLGMIIALPRHG